MSCRPEMVARAALAVLSRTTTVCRLSLSSTTQTGNGQQGTLFPNRPCIVQRTVLVFAAAAAAVVAVEAVEAVDILAQQMPNGKVGVVKAAVADVTETVSTLKAALVRYGTAVAARSLG